MTPREDSGSEHIEHMKLYAGLKTEIAVLATTLQEKHIQNTDRFESNFTLVLEKLKPLDELIKKVELHSKQISMWRGMQAAFIFIFGSILSYFGIHRH